MTFKDAIAPIEAIDMYAEKPGGNGRTALIFPPPGKHTSTFIFLVGYADTAAGWIDLPRSWRAKGLFPNTKVVILGPQWQDYEDKSKPSAYGWWCVPDRRKVDFGKWKLWNIADPFSNRIRSQVMYIHERIAKEIKKGIPASRVMIAGYSQGGILSVFSGGLFPEKLAGIWAYVAPISDRTFTHKDAEHGYPNRRTKTLWGYGTKDRIMRKEWIDWSREAMHSNGFVNAELKIYPGQTHHPHGEVLDDLDKMVEECLYEEESGQQVMSKL